MNARGPELRPGDRVVATRYDSGEGTLMEITAAHAKVRWDDPARGGSEFADPRALRRIGDRRVAPDEPATDEPGAPAGPRDIPPPEAYADDFDLEPADAPDAAPPHPASQGAGTIVPGDASRIHASDPVDLWGHFPPPDLPSGLLPPVIEDFARARGDQMGCDPAGLVLAALVTCAAAIPDRIKIKVKTHEDWYEAPRLWGALVGDPSTKKSPILSAATGPLCALDAELFRQWAQARADFDALERDEKKAAEPPPQVRLRIEDATVESAQGVLAESPDGVLLLQDELSGFFGQMDKYNGGKAAAADRAFWLRGWNGGAYAVNRVGRGARLIENASLNLLGGIQPQPIRKVANESHDDGLLQRMLPVLLRPAKVGQDAPMPPAARAYADLIGKLRRLPSPSWMGPGAVQFDQAAQEIRRRLEHEHVRLQSIESVSPKLASHVGKYDAIFARLCLVFHCIESVDHEHLPEAIGAKLAQRVADFLHGFLFRHAVAFYAGLLGLSDDHDRLTAVAGFILAHRLERITNRDVQRGDRTMRSLRDHEIRSVLEQLDALGWLTRVENPRPTLPPHWLVNPAVHERFAERAEQERRRRGEARNVLHGALRAKP